MTTSNAALVYTAKVYAPVAAVNAALESYELPQATLTFMGLRVESDTTTGGVRTVNLALVPTSNATATAQLQPGGGAPSASPVFSLTLTGAGSGYAAPPVVSIVPAAGDMTGGGAAARAFLSVGSVNVTAGGASYAAPVVTFVGGLSAGGVAATATATVGGGGAITGITVTSAGSGYVGIPEVVITDSAGSGAEATAVLVVSNIELTNPGKAYSAAPTVVITPLFKSQWPDGANQAAPLNNLFTIGLQKASLCQIVASPPVLS
jgi:hypothetical protein